MSTHYYKYAYILVCSFMVCYSSIYASEFGRFDSDFSEDALMARADSFDRKVVNQTLTSRDIDRALQSEKDLEQRIMVYFREQFADQFPGDRVRMLTEIDNDVELHAVQPNAQTVVADLKSLEYLNGLDHLRRYLVLK